MNLLVRDEIQEFFEDNSIDYREYIQTMLENGYVNDFAVVNFNINNTTLLNIEDDDTIIQYLKYKNVDPEDILLVSSILCDGFLKTIRGYYDTLQFELTGNSNDKL